MRWTAALAGGNVAGGAPLFFAAGLTDRRA